MIRRLFARATVPSGKLEVFNERMKDRTEQWQMLERKLVRLWKLEVIVS